MSSHYPRIAPTAGFALLAAGLFLPAVQHSFAQTAPAATSPAANTVVSPGPVLPTLDPTAASTKEDVIQLSPFQVDTSRENGYYAPNTLSGTRLNTRVEDLGGSITVITKQQLLDTASIDINDIFRYETNTEGIYDFTAQSASSPTTDPIQQNPATSTRVRGISAPNITLDYFTHTARIPIDTYNIDSAEISRGPNSTVAGLGSPAGTINTNRANANVTRETNNVAFRADSYGGYRGSFNFNRPIIQDKLGLRVAGLYAENKYKQKPSYDLHRRLYGAITYRPFKNTTIRGKAEVFHENRQAPNSLTPRDGVSEWIAAGRPTWNPQTFTATVNGTKIVLPVTADNTAFPAGLFVNTTTYTRPSMYIDNGQVQFWEVNRLGTTNNPNATTTSNVRMISSGSAYMRGTVNAGTLYQVPGINNRSLYDWTSLNAVPTNWNYDHAAIYTAEIEQRIIEGLYFRGAWHLEDSVDYNRNITNPPTLQIDVNETLLNGQPNPYFLRPYISNIEPTIFRSPEYNDAAQASLSYELNLSQHKGWLGWVGRHQFGANYETRRVTNGTFRYREAIIDPNHSWLQPPLTPAGTLNYTNGPAVDRPTYQYYVGPRGALGYTPGYTPPKSGVAGVYNLNWFNGATGQWVSEPATFGTAPYLSSQSRAETRTRSITWQGHLLRDYLVVTGGFRKDNYRTRNSNTSGVDPSTGLYTYTALDTWGPWTYASGPTRMFSAVLYPLHNNTLGLTYSRSSSFLPQPQAVDLFGNILPNTYGHGQDVGVITTLLKDKLFISVKVYKTTVSNDRTSNSTLGSRIARLEAGDSPFLPGTSSDRQSLYNFAQTVARNRLGASATQEQVDVVASGITQFPAGFQSALNANLAGAAIRGTADTEGKGAEVELSYNPTYSWNLKFTGAKTEAINTRIENNLQDYINLRMPYWLGVKDDQGNPWWSSTALTAQSAQAFYQTAVLIPLKVDQALLGKSNPQVKKYTWRALTTYRFTHGRLNNIAVGGSARWDDRSVIGYYGGAPDPDNVVRTLDVNRPIYDPARYQFDFWTSYSLRFFKDKVRAKVQLNLVNAFENGGLRVTAVNPDGQPYNFRIINPRQLILTTTFDF